MGKNPFPGTSLFAYFCWVQVIPFNQPFIGQQLREKVRRWADGDPSVFTGAEVEKTAGRIRELCGVSAAFLTTTGTQAMEIAALLLNLRPGDEVIMPSFTFVSTANPFVLRGAVPVFADIRPDTLCLDPAAVEQAITPKTRALVPVHYAGHAADMEALTQIAAKHSLRIIEDAAHGIGASCGGKALGSMGDAGILSFDQGKNIHCFKGGALLLQHEDWIEPAERIVEKGTDRRAFERGSKDFYTWTEPGCNGQMSLLSTIFLADQLEHLDEINARRLQLWSHYHDLLTPLQKGGIARLPAISEGCKHNGHIFYLLCQDTAQRDALIRHLAAHGITAAFHYIPLHTSPAGLQYGRFSGEDRFTTTTARCLIRLPLFHELTHDQVDYICGHILEFFRS